MTMTFGVKVLRVFFPKHEEQRRRLRHAILQAEACAEDLRRTIGKMHLPAKPNGKGKP